MDAFAGDLLDLGGLFDHKILILCSGDDADSDRMSRCGLACRRDLEEFLLGSCACRKDRLNHEVSFCDGSCLIHDNRFYSFQVFKCDSTFKEDSFLGTCADPGEECQRNA